MVLRSPALPFLALLAPAACLQFNEHALPVGGDKDAGAAEAAAGSDTRPAPTPDAARDLPAADAGDASGPPPDATAPGDTTTMECTPREMGCSPDGKSTRTCNAQGRWTEGTVCQAQTACSAGVCLCSQGCGDEATWQTPATGLVDGLASGSSSLYLAINGSQASIRRFDLTTGKDSAVKTGEPGFTLFGVDSDPTGNLLACTDAITTTGARTGQLTLGTQRLDTAPCTHVRLRDTFVYFKGDNLYRKTLDPSAPRQTVSAESMTTFEIAGDHLYFLVQEPSKDGVLKRLSLADPTRVEMLLRLPDTSFLRLMPDASHVYLVEDGRILRVPLTGAAQPEVFWQGTGADAWGMAQTDTHVYWSTTTYSTAMACSEAQVMRQPKAGGQATVLAKTTGYCGGQMIRVGERIYTALWVGPPATTPTKILRVRL